MNPHCEHINPVLLAALGSSSRSLLVNVFNCAVMATSMSWIDLKHLPFVGHFDFRKEAEVARNHSWHMQWMREHVVSLQATFRGMHSWDSLCFWSYLIWHSQKRCFRAASGSGKKDEIRCLSKGGNISKSNWQQCAFKIINFKNLSTLHTFQSHLKLIFWNPLMDSVPFLKSQSCLIAGY